MPFTQAIEELRAAVKQTQGELARLRSDMEILVTNVAPMVEIDCQLVADALLDFGPLVTEDPVMASLKGVVAAFYREDFLPALKIRSWISIALNREISADVKRQLRAALCDDEWLEKVRHEISLRAAADGWVDFGSLAEWFKAHWLQVLQILLALLPLFLNSNRAQQP